MNIRSPGPKPEGGNLVPRAGRSAPDSGPRARIPGKPDVRSGDRIDLSPAAREIEAAPAPDRSLDPGRARILLARVAAGFYDRPEVREQVLSRIAGDAPAAGAGAP